MGLDMIIISSQRVPRMCSLPQHLDFKLGYTTYPALSNFEDECKMWRATHYDAQGKSEHPNMQTPRGEAHNVDPVSSHFFLAFFSLLLFIASI